MDFRAHPLLRNAHLMTIAPALHPIQWLDLNARATPIELEVEPGTKILLHTHDLDKKEQPVLVLVHGLEGSSSSPYVLSTTKKALKMGFSVVRVNLRNCGGTLHLTPTLYNAGLSKDVIAIAEYLHRDARTRSVFVCGWSLGGNIVLKAAGEPANQASELISGVCAVSPSADLNACIEAIEIGLNRMYEFKFLIGLRKKIRAKAKLFPDLYDASKLSQVTGLRSFDELFTAPDAGYRSALDYYTGASALPLLRNIRIPTLIIAAQDDPIVPFRSMRAAPSDFITLLAPKHGGHGGFIQDALEVNDAIKSRDRAWAENRVLEFCLTLCKTS